MPRRRRSTPSTPLQVQLSYDLWSYVTCFVHSPYDVIRLFGTCQQLHVPMTLRAWIANKLSVPISSFVEDLPTHLFLRTSVCAMGAQVGVFGDCLWKWRNLKSHVNLNVVNDTFNIEASADLLRFFKKEVDSEFAFVFGRKTCRHLDLSTFTSRRHIGVTFPAVSELLHGNVLNVHVLGSNGLLVTRGGLDTYYEQGETVSLMPGDILSFPTEVPEYQNSSFKMQISTVKLPQA